MLLSLSLSYRDRVQFGCVVVCVSVIVVSVRLLLRHFKYCESNVVTLRFRFSLSFVSLYSIVYWPCLLSIIRVFPYGCNGLV